MLSKVCLEEISDKKNSFLYQISINTLWYKMKFLEEVFIKIFEKFVFFTIKYLKQ